MVALPSQASTQGSIALRALTDEQVRQLATATRRRDLSAWEQQFLADLRERRRPLSDKQAEILARCARGRPDYAAINRAAMHRLPEVLARLLPGGKLVRKEYECGDLRGGEGQSLRVNLTTGAWADFAMAGTKGGDPVSLAAAVTGKRPEDAAWGLAAMLGMEGAAHG